MSTSFAFDIKSPAGYATDPKVKIAHEASTWKKWQQFSRDLNQDYPDENKVGWFTIMQSASDFKNYSHGVQLSTDKHNQFKTPRLRFGCIVQYPVATQVIGIMKDLSERAARHFNVETLLYNAPGVLTPEVLDTLVQTMKDELHDTAPKERVQPATTDNVAIKDEKQSLPEKQAIDVPRMTEFICFAFLISVAYSLILNVYKFGVERQMETIPTIVLCLLMTGVLIYRQVYWETIGGWNFERTMEI